MFSNDIDEPTFIETIIDLVDQNKLSEETFSRLELKMRQKIVGNFRAAFPQGVFRYAVPTGPLGHAAAGPVVQATHVGGGQAVVGASLSGPLPGLAGDAGVAPPFAIGGAAGRSAVPVVTLNALRDPAPLRPLQPTTAEIARKLGAPGLSDVEVDAIMDELRSAHREEARVAAARAAAARELALHREPPARPQDGDSSLDEVRAQLRSLQDFRQEELRRREEEADAPRLVARTTARDEVSSKAYFKVQVSLEESRIRSAVMTTERVDMMTRPYLALTNFEAEFRGQRVIVFTGRLLPEQRIASLMTSIEPFVARLVAGRSQGVMMQNRFDLAYVSNLLVTIPNSPLSRLDQVTRLVFVFAVVLTSLFEGEPAGGKRSLETITTDMLRPIYLDGIRSAIFPVLMAQAASAGLLDRHHPARLPDDFGFGGLPSPHQYYGEGTGYNTGCLQSDHGYGGGSVRAASPPLLGGGGRPPAATRLPPVPQPPFVPQGQSVAQADSGAFPSQPEIQRVDRKQVRGGRVTFICAFCGLVGDDLRHHSASTCHAYTDRTDHYGTPMRDFHVTAPYRMSKKCVYFYRSSARGPADTPVIQDRSRFVADPATGSAFDRYVPTVAARIVQADYQDCLSYSNGGRGGAR